MRHPFSLLLAATCMTVAACGSPATPLAENPNSQTAASSSVQKLDRAPVIPKQSSDAYYISGAEAVSNRANGKTVQPAKNVILFVGDGMGVSTITAGRIYAGQMRGQNGEAYRLAMDTLPNVALSKTYSHDFQVSDSAATATAMVAGMKANSRTLGVTSDVAVGNCASQNGKGSDTLFELAERNGLATGIISTARITHATPASTYAEAAMRDWEDDTSVKDDCVDIARQLIEWEAGDGFEIALGGGRRHFMTTDQADPEYPDKTGRRKDNRDLTTEWTAKSDDHVYVFGMDDFSAVDFSTSAKVLGLFEPSHMQYELDRRDEAGEPSIAEMTRAAITRLSQDEDGFVLMVEGGRIDHAHHGVNAARALSDTDAFDQAIAVALEMTSPEDTLIIVTADHSHTLTMAGYPRRNNPILGKSQYPVSNDFARAGDGMPYTTLSYANGQTGCVTESGKKTCARRDLSEVNTEERDFQQPALVPMPSETHAGEDVAIFASGPGSEFINGVMEQHEIFHVMGRAMGLIASNK